MKKVIRLHSGQSQVYSDLFIKRSVRNAVVVCSRGWGKSMFGAVAAKTAAQELMRLPASVPNKNIYMVAPTFDQAITIFYPYLIYDLEMGTYALSHSENTGKIVLPSKTTIRLVSYEAIARIRGTGCYFCVWDEVASCRSRLGPRNAWEGIIQPTMLTRWSKKNANLFKAPSASRALIMGTPGGYDYLYDLYNMQEKDTSFQHYHYDYTKSPFLDPADIEHYRNTLDPIEFASEYLASFEESGARVFYNFDRSINVTKDIDDFAEDEVVYVGIDFNVGLQCTSLSAIRGNELHTLHEMKGHNDTEQLALTLKAKYGKHKIIAFPDPTGRSRKTSAATGITDFKILENNGIICMAHKKAPPMVDSVAAVNRKCKTASGLISYYVHPRCSGVIDSLTKTSWAAGVDGAVIDKSKSVEHFSDGIRYKTEFLFPITKGTKVIERGFAF